MGFLSTKTIKNTQGPSIDLLHRLECKACPLNQIKQNKNPHMLPSGTDEPLIYILGENPTKDDDEDGKHFSGKAGRFLRSRIPPKLLKKIRWNYTVRTKPLGSGTPQRTEIECCRPSIERDIAASKPSVIWGFGMLPLQWISGFTSIKEWAGKSMPVSVGGHECLYYAFEDPAHLLRYRRSWAQDKKPEAVGSEEERAFGFALARAIEDLEDLPETVVHTKEVALYGIEIYKGGPGQLQKVLSILEWFCKQKEVGLDYETDGGINTVGNVYRPYSSGSKILSFALATEEVAIGVALDHRDMEWIGEERNQVIEALKTFLASSANKIVHNLAYELEWTGVKFSNRLLRHWRDPDHLSIKHLGWECTLTQAATLDERRGTQSLDFLCRQYFGLGLKAISSVDSGKLNEENLDKVLSYNALDAKYHLLLHKAQKRRLKAQGLWEVYKIGLRRIPTVVLSQIKGVSVNRKEALSMAVEYEANVKVLKKEIAGMSCVKQYIKQFKKEYNPESNTDAVAIFRDILKCPEILIPDAKNRDKTRYSTEEDVLVKIDHPLAKATIALRKERKKLSTYVYLDTTDSKKFDIEPKVWDDALIHAIFNHGPRTETFRLSSENPNLQNIPKRMEGNKRVRKQIIARKGHTLIAIDYGQIEARVIAMATKDKRFVKYLKSRHDIHMDWAKRIANDYPKRIGGRPMLDDPKAMKDFRTDIKKEWTFPLFFGARLESVAGYLDIPIERIEPAYKDFRQEFDGVFQWQKKLIAFYNTNGYVENLLGRRRRAPMSPNELINAPIQSTACEIVMDGMNRLSEKAMEEEDTYFQPIMNVHDELVFDVPSDKLDYYLPKIAKTMVSAKFDFINVPITAEVSVGQDLLNMKALFDLSSDRPNHFEWKE